MTGDSLSGAAVGLAAVLALGRDSSRTLRQMLAFGPSVAPAAAVAEQRVRAGRLTTAVT